MFNDPTAKVSPLSISELMSTQDPDTSLRDYAGLLYRRWKLIALASLLVFGLCFSVVLLQKKIYQSASKLVVATKDESSSSGASGGDANALLSGLAAMREGRNVDTQAEIINSGDLLVKAFRALDGLDPDHPLTEDGKLVKLADEKPLRVGPDGKPLLHTDHWRRLGFSTKKNGEVPSGPPEWSFQIKPHEDTDVILITTNAYNPTSAALFADEISETYLQQDLDRNRLATEQAKDYVADEVGKIRVQLIASSKVLAKYQKAVVLVEPVSQISNAARGIASLETILDTAKGSEAATQRATEVILNQLHKVAPEINAETAVTENPEYTILRQELLAQQQILLQNKSEYQPDAPEITNVQTQIDQISRHMNRLVKTQVTGVRKAVNPVMQSLLAAYADALSKQMAAAATVQVTEGELAQRKQDFLKFPDNARGYAELLQKTMALKRTLDMLSDRYYALLIEEKSSIPNGLVADHAYPPATPFSPKISLALAVSIILGILVGVASGVVAEKLDTKVHVPEDAEKITALPILTFVPEAVSEIDGSSNLYFGETVPSQAFSEAFRLLRNNITFAAVDRKSESLCLALTSSSSGEGKSTVSVNAAISLAMDGKKVILVDLDLRRATIQKWVQLPNDVGLTSLARGDVNLDGAIRRTRWENLDCLTSGPLPPDPSEFLNSNKCRSVIEELRERYDYVIVDAPPCPGLSDVQIISRFVDGMIVIATLDLTSKPALHATMRLLRQAGAPFAGLVVNRVKSTKSGYTYYYGYYGYGSYYGEDDKKKKPTRKKTKTGEKTKVS